MSRPDIEGLAARAWSIGPGFLVRGCSVRVSALESYLVNAAWLDEYERIYDQAEWELRVRACDRTGSIMLEEPPRLLWQFHGVEPSEAVEIAEYAVHAMCGGLIPEVDSQREWHGMLVRLLNDYRRGYHGGPERPTLAIDPETLLLTGAEEVG